MSWAQEPTGRVPGERELVAVLAEARRLGLLGPGPVEDHVEHSRGFAVAAGITPRRRVVDLGSGAGVPGLVLAVAWPHVPVVLVDAAQRATMFLEGAVDRLGVRGRVSIVRQRAEVLGRDPQWRGTAELVVARGFGRPAVVAECAAPLLALGGLLVVSEPPERPEDRWPSDGLVRLGLGRGRVVEHAGKGYRVLPQDGVCPPSLPRRPGMPAKRPLF